MDWLPPLHPLILAPEYTADKVWHERQFPVPGLPVGLSPLIYAAWSIGEYLSEQQFHQQQRRAVALVVLGRDRAEIVRAPYQALSGVHGRHPWIWPSAHRVSSAKAPEGPTPATRVRIPYGP